MSKKSETACAAIREQLLTMAIDASDATMLITELNELPQGSFSDERPAAPPASDNIKDDLVAALHLLLDHVDYTTGACTVVEPVGACLPQNILQQVKAILRAAKGTS